MTFGGGFFPIGIDRGTTGAEGSIPALSGAAPVVPAWGTGAVTVTPVRLIPAVLSVRIAFSFVPTYRLQQPAATDRESSRPPMDITRKILRRAGLNWLNSPDEFPLN